MDSHDLNNKGYFNHHKTHILQLFSLNFQTFSNFCRHFLEDLQQ